MRNPRFWVGLALSLATLYLAFRGIDIGELSTALAQASYVYLVPALVLIGSTQVMRAYRWGALFYPDPPPLLGRLFSALSIGYLVSTILPARLGDVVRAFLIGRAASTNQGQRVAQAISTVIVERAFDVFSIIALLVLLLPMVNLPEILARPAISITVLFFVMSGGLWLATWQRARALALVGWTLHRVPRLNGERWTQRVAGLMDGLLILQAPAALGKVAVWSLIIWCVGGVGYNYLVMSAFGLHTQLGPPTTLIAAALVQVVVALGATVPSSPGYIGVYHAGVLLALTVFGIPRAEALAYALVSHGANFGLLIVIGAIYLWREGLSLGQLTQSAATAPSSSAGMGVSHDHD